MTHKIIKEKIQTFLRMLASHKNTTHSAICRKMEIPRTTYEDQLTYGAQAWFLVMSPYFDEIIEYLRSQRQSLIAKEQPSNTLVNQYEPEKLIIKARIALKHKNQNLFEIAKCKALAILSKWQYQPEAAV